MGLLPNTLYPLQTIPPSADYPYGSSQEVTVFGDGTGFPWKNPFINDLYGLLQGIVQRAGITPSGNPDTALVSDYIDALGTIMGRKQSTTTSMLAADLNGALVVQTLGYAVINDGGGAFWYSTGLVSVPNAGTAIFFAGKIYDSLGNEFILLGNSVNPRQFGALGDGATIDTVAFQSAIDYAGANANVSTVIIDRGTYKIDAGLDLKDRVNIVGEDRGSCILDFSGASPASFTTTYCLFGTGTVSTIANLNADVDAGDVSIDFASNHGRSEDNVIVLFDPTASSLNVANVDYFAGEMCQVREITDPDTLVVTRPLYAGYASATIDVGVLNPISLNISGVTIKGIDGTSTIGIIGVYNGRDCNFTDLHLSGTQRVCIETRRCYSTGFDSIIGRDYGSDVGINYILGVTNCHLVRASRLQGGSTRHFLSTGTDSASWSIPNRELLITDCHVDETSTSDQSLGIQGNTEYLRVANCTLGGTTVSGRYSVHDNCTIYGGPGDVASSEGSAVIQTETHGAEHTFRGCTFLATRDVGVNTALVHLSDSSNALRNIGTFRFEDCTFDMKGFTGKVARLFSRTAVAGAEQALIVNNCQMIGGNTNNTFDCLQGVLLTAWTDVRISSCTFKGVELVIDAAADIEVSGCDSRDSVGRGIRVVSLSGAMPYTDQVIRIANNHVRRAWTAGIDLNNISGSIVVEAHLTGNTSLNNNESGGAVDSSSSIAVQAIRDCVMQNNTVGDTRGVTKQLRAWYVANCTTVVSNSTVVVQGLIPITELSDISNTNFHRWNDRSSDEDVSRSTGKAGFGGGDPNDAIAQADILLVGDGLGDSGLTVWSSATGDGRLVFGDPSDDDRCQLRCDHTNTELDLLVGAGLPTQWSQTAMKPGSSGTIDLGLVSRKWATCWANDIHSARTHADGGSPVSGSQTSRSSTWGTVGASDTATGTDAAGTVTVSSGTGAGIGGSPTLTFTYIDGTWTNVPIVMISGLGSNAEEFTVTAQTATSFVVTLVGVTPASSTDYSFNYLVIGR